MKEAIVEFLQSITGNSFVTVALVSMFPLIELKGAIPIGEALGLNLWQSAGLAYVGSTVISIPIFFLLVPIFNLMKRWKPLYRLTEKIEGVFKRRAEKLKDSGNGEEKVRKMLILGVYAFIAVPLPLTGVWTGTAIAVFLGLKFKESILPIVLGNLTAGAAITLLTWLFADYVEYIILGMFAFAIIMLIVFIVKVALSKPDQGSEDGKK
ncbi:MAG: small multi-drug export protein [Clostridia bacterium]|nr:small multi-drug export protein [Clostridia bacterium]